MKIASGYRQSWELANNVVCCPCETNSSTIFLKKYEEVFEYPLLSVTRTMNLLILRFPKTQSSLHKRRRKWLGGFLSWENIEFCWGRQKPAFFLFAWGDPERCGRVTQNSETLLRLNIIVTFWTFWLVLLNSWYPHCYNQAPDFLTAGL